MDVDSILEDQSLKEVLQQVIREGLLEHPTSLGIAKKVLGGASYEELSQGQQGVFDQYIAPYLEPKCERCKEAMTIHEAVGAYLLRGIDFDHLYCEDCRALFYARDND